MSPVDIWKVFRRWAGKKRNCVGKKRKGNLESLLSCSYFRKALNQSLLVFQWSERIIPGILWCRGAAHHEFYVFFMCLFIFIKSLCPQGKVFTPVKGFTQPGMRTHSFKLVIRKSSFCPPNFKSFLFIMEHYFLLEKNKWLFCRNRMTTARTLTISEANTTLQQLVSASSHLSLHYKHQKPNNTGLMWHLSRHTHQRKKDMFWSANYKVSI